MRAYVRHEDAREVNLRIKLVGNEHDGIKIAWGDKQSYDNSGLYLDRAGAASLRDGLTELIDFLAECDAEAERSAAEIEGERERMISGTAKVS